MSPGSTGFTSGGGVSRGANGSCPYSRCAPAKGISRSCSLDLRKVTSTSMYVTRLPEVLATLTAKARNQLSSARNFSPNLTFPTSVLTPVIFIGGSKSVFLTMILSCSCWLAPVAGISIKAATDSPHKKVIRMAGRLRTGMRFSLAAVRCREVDRAGYRRQQQSRGYGTPPTYTRQEEVSRNLFSSAEREKLTCRWLIRP